MPGFTALVPSLYSTAARARVIGDELAEEVARTRRQAVALCTEGWRGRAREAFDRGFADWDVGARELIAALERLAESLEDCGRAYASCDAVASDELLRDAS